MAEDGMVVGSLAGLCLARLQHFAREKGWRGFGLVGPGVLIAVGYVDPGNWATDLSGGARYGFELLSVVLLANLVAAMAQALCVRLGIATGKGLADVCRESFSRPVVMLLWFLTEIAMVATDLAELVGSAVALKLLFGIGLLPGVLIVSAGTFVVLSLGLSDRKLSGLVALLMLVVAASFTVLLVLAKPHWLEVAAGLLPTPALIADPSMLLIAIGIVGATVMPHNLYLHSGLLAVVGRRLEAGSQRSTEVKKAAIRAGALDSSLSLTIAFFMNAAILIAAGAVFHANGLHEVSSLSSAYRLLDPVLGSGIAATLFAVALLAAGQSSTITGTLAGQMITEGFLRIRLSPLIRRLITRGAALGPAILYFSLAGEDNSAHLLIASQVVLSLQLPFALVPLVHFTASRRLMGDLAVGRRTALCCWAMALLLVGLNVLLIGDMVA